jgi:hypothetical protein
MMAAIAPPVRWIWRNHSASPTNSGRLTMDATMKVIAAKLIQWIGGCLRSSAV